VGATAPGAPSGRRRGPAQLGDGLGHPLVGAEQAGTGHQHLAPGLDRLERRVTEGFIETNTKLADLSGQVDGLSGRLDSLSGRVESGLAALGDRIENVFTGQFGQDVRDLKERVRVLEGRFVHERPPPYGEPK